MAQTSPQDFHGISVHITITVAPENVPKFLDVLRPAFDEIVNATPECTFFEVFVSSDEPGMIRWVECWSKDRQWLIDVQMKKEFYKPVLESIESLMIKPREFQVFDRLPGGWARSKPEHFAIN